MTNPNDPATAVPYVSVGGNIQYDVYQGLTKREAFAMAALQGINATGISDFNVMLAVQQADALIDELNMQK